MEDDRRARFTELFDRAYPAVRRYAHHRGLRGHDADDVVAEVFVVAWRRLDDVPSDDPIPWLFAVARNVWRNQRRSDVRRSRLVARLPAPEPTPPVDPPDDDARDAVTAALASLSDAEREVLLLVAWDGLTSEQLGRALDCSAGAARVRLHRARARFAAALDAVTNPATRTDLLHVSTTEGSGT